MAAESAEVVVAGGGLAAARTVRALRELGFGGSIRLLSEEPEWPYDRPPLSKAYLLGRAADDDIRLLDERRAADMNVDVRLGCGATGLEPGPRVVRLADGTRLSYGDLVIATGARVRRLAALEGFPGVHHLRTAPDSRRLRAALRERPSVAIVGGGFIGLEVAAAARTLGCEVTVVEELAAPLASVIGEELGRLVQCWHEDRGVGFRCGVRVRGARREGAATCLELADGGGLAADVVVVGVGIVPAVDWLARSGLELHAGVVCDENGRTSVDHVYAAGDVACRHLDGQCAPGGHWTSAGDQARRVAAAIMAAPAGPPGDGTYFWSDQYDARFQFAGVAGTRVDIESGSVESGAFLAVLRGAGGEETGVFAMNSAREFVKRRLALQAAARALTRSR